MRNLGICWEYIKSDYQRYTDYMSNGKRPPFKMYKELLLCSNPCFNYTFWMRLAHRKNVFQLLAKYMHRRLSRKYNLQIPYTLDIGYGFYIGHGAGVVIAGKTKIGNNVNISQFLSIGTNEGTPAHIGDNVYIGPNVCIVGDVKVGDNSTIGAGAVVVKDVPANATVAGVPAKVINYQNPGRYIVRKYNC